MLNVVKVCFLAYFLIVIKKIIIILSLLLQLCYNITRFCGGGRIRTFGALITHDGFQDRCIKPLCHTSNFTLPIDKQLTNIHLVFLLRFKNLILACFLTLSKNYVQSNVTSLYLTIKGVRTYHTFL